MRPLSIAAAVVAVVAVGASYPFPGKVGSHSIRNTGAPSGVHPLWEPTYLLNRSTIVQPCNESGFFDPSFLAKFGVVDVDWSNAKAIYTNQHPMNCEELLVEQGAMVKAINPDTHYFVYRNLVKALPWFTNVNTKLRDPAYRDWFLPFAVPGPFGNNTYHVPQCDDNFDPPLCSDRYHDQEQTPEHPHGDGSCAEPCDCNGVPCGEYLWNPALLASGNTSLRDYIVSEVILGPTALGNANVSGFYLDDIWSNTTDPQLPWMPAIGFCDTKSPFGGPTEENAYCYEDMMLTQENTTTLTNGWSALIADVTSAIIANGGWAWQLFNDVSTPSPSNCTSFFRGAGLTYNTSTILYAYTNGSEAATLPHFDEDIAGFLLIRGDYAWIGFAWLGCTGERVGPCFLTRLAGIRRGAATALARE
jgi:hypothetical protein